MKTVHFFIAIPLFLALCSTAQTTGQTYWQQQVNYSIEVSLNDADKTLDGQIRMEYINHSPDSLAFIWIHLWPNAYKNDKTAFSEQKLLMGQTEFYYSEEKKRGYINRLNFSANGQPALAEDHPQYLDAVKLILPKPVLPGRSVSISTPFHVKLPYKFSRGGYKDQYFSITQWFPKAALYDKKGWHVMPYLESGEYYSDFGNYSVKITLPANYAVSGTGMLRNRDESEWLKSRTQKISLPAVAAAKKNIYSLQKEPQNSTPPSVVKTKTLEYLAENVVDFAWFADKRFIVKYDTLQLNGKTIDVWNYVLPAHEQRWKNSIANTKRAVRFYSDRLGNYPYPQVSVVCDAVSVNDGMEYPMVTALNTVTGSQEDLDILIAHEVGHNWLMGILGSNERDCAWMDEGFNTYFEDAYHRSYYTTKTIKTEKKKGKQPNENQMGEFMLNTIISQKRDQAINTPSENFSDANYYVVTYYKTALWLQKLEKIVGTEKMDRIMRSYYSQWQFKHPAPEDFKAVAQTISGQDLSQHFAQLNTTGYIDTPLHRSTSLTGFYNFNNTLTKKYIGIAPALGINNYDKLQIGLLIHNYNLPASPFQFVATPLYATGSKRITGYARGEYSFYGSGKNLYKTTIYANAARFSYDEGTGLDGQKIFSGFTKFVPGVKFRFREKTALSTLHQSLDFKTFIISETQLNQLPLPAPATAGYYDIKGENNITVIPQVTYGWQNTRKLYPWSVELQVQQVKQIVRTTAVAKYFLNYNSRNEGIALRLFAGKIFYTRQKNDQLRNNNSRYHFTMYAPNGQQDYTYSNAFAERSQSVELAGRQITMRDGGFKYRSDFSSVQPGLKSNGIDYFDNWMATLNLELDIPNKWNPLNVLPFKIPLKVFADIGTSASPWMTAAGNQNKFLYSAGLQLPLFRCITFYYPLLQSKAFDEPNSVNNPNRAGGPSWWQKRLTFSIDINNIAPKIGGLPLLN